MSSPLIPSEAAPDIGLYHVQGEDAPFWLAGVFAAIGLLMALAAAYLLASSQIVTPGSAQEPTPTAQMQPAPKTLVRPAPAPLRHEPPVDKEGAPGDRLPALATRREDVCLPVVSIAFPYNSVQPILEGVQVRLEPLLDWLKGHPDATLVVEGHTDPRGGEAYNLMLSYSRAQAVISWLSSLGLEKQRVTPLAAGKAPPNSPAITVGANRMALLQVPGVAHCQTEGAQRQ